MIDRSIIRAIIEWIASRPTQRRIEKLRARRVELIGRIGVESRNHRRVSHHYAQLKQATTELLRLERRTAA
jgi:hypothetical protein